MPESLLKRNRQWAAETVEKDPEFFTELASQQHPRFLWIGCADSRVPANQITGLAPGEVFVHRNVANLVVQTDFNLLSVLQYAVDVLKVRHIIICGHYGCGGVKAAFENQRFGLIDNWLSSIRSLHRDYRDEFDSMEKEAALDKLCELNVRAQACNVARTTILENAWAREQEVSIHSWIYRLDQGLIIPLADEITEDLGLGGLPATLADWELPNGKKSDSD